MSRLPISDRRAVDRLQIAAPCQAAWEAMPGGAERRYCARCDQHVLDLSAMPAARAEAVALRIEAGERLCVRATRDRRGRLLTRRGLLTSAAAALAALLAGCAPLRALGLRQPDRPMGDATMGAPRWDPQLEQRRRAEREQRERRQPVLTDVSADD